MRLSCRESLAALGDHGTGQASVGTRGACKTIGGFCGGSCCVGDRLLLSGVEWAGERCHDVHVLFFVLWGRSNFGVRCGGQGEKAALL